MLRDTYDPDRRAAIEPGDHYDPIPGFPEICIGIFSNASWEEAAAVSAGRSSPRWTSAPGRCPCTGAGRRHRGRPVFAPRRRPFRRQLCGEPHPLGRAVLRVQRLLRGAAQGHHRRAPHHPTAAVRDEGLSYHYLPPAEEIALDPACVAACRDALDSLGFPFVEGKTWTTDAFFRETRGKVQRRKEQGCLCVEMECASLAAVARFREVPFAQFFWSADNLDAEEWDARDLSQQGASVSEKCFAAALETASGCGNTLGGVGHTWRRSPPFTTTSKTSPASGGSPSWTPWAWPASWGWRPWRSTRTT